MTRPFPNAGRVFRRNRQPRQRWAFSLVELLSVIAIVGALVALLLPAIQSARESARKASCQSRLKQQALAVHDYHGAHRILPPLYTDRKSTSVSVAFGLQTHSWRSMILPFIEQRPLYDSIVFAEYATHAKNQAAIGAGIEILNCPSAVRAAAQVRGLWQGRSQFNEALIAATTDYNASAGYVEAGVVSRDVICDPTVPEHFWEEVWSPGAWGEVIYDDVIWKPPTVRRVNFSDISDGLTQTMLLFERAALPDQHFDGGATVEPHDPPQYRTWGNVGLWAVSGCDRLNQIYHQSGVPLVNADNLLGMYSFHPQLANAAFGDGSVQVVADSVEADVVAAWVSRDGEESVNPSSVH